MSDTNRYLGAANSAMRFTFDQPDLTEAERGEIIFIHEKLVALLEARRQKDPPRYR